MSKTRGQIISRTQNIIGNQSSDLTTYLQGSLDDMLFALWELHDWEFKHKTSSFNTVNGTQQYDLTASASDLRSVNHVELIYDKTNGRVLRKIELKQGRSSYPKEDSTGQPSNWAPWGRKDVFLFSNPDGAYECPFLYSSKPTLPTNDNDDLETVCGVPDYVQFLLEKMLLAEGYLYDDDSRRVALLDEIDRRWLPLAITADQSHLVNTARFKFWEEELQPHYPTFDDFLRHTFWCDD